MQTEVEHEDTIPSVPSCYVKSQILEVGTLATDVKYDDMKLEKARHCLEACALYTPVNPPGLHLEQGLGSVTNKCFPLSVSSVSLAKK